MSTTAVERIGGDRMVSGPAQALDSLRRSPDGKEEGPKCRQYLLAV